MTKSHPSNHAYQEAFKKVSSSTAAKMHSWRLGLREWFRRRGQSAPTGLVLYDGPSEINGEPIVVIATCIAKATVNPKTGDLVQVYILPKATFPGEAVKTGADASVCGSCPQRPSAGGACYVNAGWAPSRIWSAFHNGKYTTLTPEEQHEVFAGAALRLGAWGDPAAVPLGVWNNIHSVAWTVIAYTHMWRTLGPLWHWSMASVDSIQERRLARRAGWKTFRVVPHGEKRTFGGEQQCLAQSHGLPCLSCRGCSGADGRSFWIRSHGQRVKRAIKEER